MLDVVVRIALPSTEMEKHFEGGLRCTTVHHRFV